MKKLLVVITILVGALFGSNVLAVTMVGQAPSIIESWTGTGIRYDVTPVFGSGNSVDALLIGAKTPLGAPDVTGNTPSSWKGMTLTVDSGSLTASSGSTVLFQGLPTSFAGYSYAYLFYDTTGNTPIMNNIYGQLFVDGGTLASPFVYTHFSIDPSNAPTGGYTPTGSGTTSTVPLPSALLLFGPGLVGLAAVRRRFKK